jgi:hypothetical protein
MQECKVFQKKLHCKCFFKNVVFSTGDGYQTMPNSIESVTSIFSHFFLIKILIYFSISGILTLFFSQKIDKILNFCYFVDNKKNLRIQNSFYFIFGGIIIPIVILFIPFVFLIYFIGKTFEYKFFKKNQ